VVVEVEMVRGVVVVVVVVEMVLAVMVVQVWKGSPAVASI
jgi:hypothetical protein